MERRRGIHIPFKFGSNRPMFDKFVNIVQQMGDVNFIFESSGVDSDDDVIGSPAKKIARKAKSNVGGGDVIKISAHKKVLAASSPVFNAMFNSQLEKSGDVKIVDVSPDAFCEFLQIFYSLQVNLTMENLDEVMKLVDKYDVEAGWPLVDSFFEKKLTAADILYGLHLAVKFRRDNLITRCANMIEENSAKVCDMIEFDDNCKPKLRSNPNERPMTDADLANIFSRIYTVIKKYISESVPAKMTKVISLKLRFSGYNTIDQLQDITFSSNRTLLLTHITYPEIYMNGPVEYQYDIVVNIAETETCHKIPARGITIKYVTPVLIQANLKYTIRVKIVTKFSSLTTIETYKTPDEPVQVASDIQITFDKIHTSSIVSLDFLRYDH